MDFSFTLHAEGLALERKVSPIGEKRRALEVYSSRGTTRTRSVFLPVRRLVSISFDRVQAEEDRYF